MVFKITLILIFLVHCTFSNIISTGTAKVNPAVNFSGLSVGPVGSLITAEIFLILFPIGKADGL
jgi:hypothetical protein